MKESIDDLYNQTLANMESTINLLAERVPKPVLVPREDGFVYRYIEKSLHQALVQKSARIVSGLHAAKHLMNHGFVQEQAVLQRMLDETREDATFLAYSIIFNEKTPLHQKYLDAFFEEEHDENIALASTKKRHEPPRRKKIHAYIARMNAETIDPSRSTEAFRTLHKTYSGYVHASSPYIMEMYGGNPTKFHVSGMGGTQFHREHRADLWNHFYRSICTFCFIAKAFGDDVLFKKIHQYFLEFEKISANNFVSKEWDEI